MIKKKYEQTKQKYQPDDTDVEFLTVVIPMELISEPGDHIFHTLTGYFFLTKYHFNTANNVTSNCERPAIKLFKDAFGAKSNGHRVQLGKIAPPKVQ